MVCDSVEPSDVYGQNCINWMFEYNLTLLHLLLIDQIRPYLENKKMSLMLGQISHVNLYLSDLTDYVSFIVQI